MSAGPYAFRPGTWLIVDDIYGVYHFADDVIQDWDGSIRNREDIDGQHPQLTFRTINYNIQPTLIHVQAATSALVSAASTIGATSVARPKSPADFVLNKNALLND